MSPIHDQTYRRYEGRRLPLGHGWAVITKAGLRTMLNRRLFLIVMLAAWVPFIVRVVQIYAVTANPALSRFAPVDATLFRNFIEQQGAFVFFVTIYTGAGLIANDRRANALQIYLSKPLLRIEYIAGKLFVLSTYLLLITLVPALLLLVAQVAFSGSLDFLKGHAYVIPAIVLASLLRVIVSAFTMLALSALSKSGRFAGVMYTGAIFFTDAIFGVLGVITGSTRVAWASITANLDQVTNAVFRETPRYETPVLVSVLVLMGLIAVSLSVLERRVRGVEVVQ